MSPADELRQAAAKVRETAKEALSGFMSELPADWIAFYRRREDNGTLDRDDVAWINLMHPGLAEPLAASLEGQGKRFNNEMGLDTPECPSCDTVPAHDHPVDFFHDGDQNRAGCDRPFTGPGDYRCICFDDSLAVARVINGCAS